jgi:hypothetical protein
MTSSCFDLCDAVKRGARLPLGAEQVKVAHAERACNVARLARVTVPAPHLPRIPSGIARGVADGAFSDALRF